jgi:hypothetical protein
MQPCSREGGILRSNAAGDPIRDSSFNSTGFKRFSVLLQAIYCSRSVTDMRDRELRDLLEQFRVHNAASGITGILIYEGEQFLGIIEGREPEGMRCLH